MKILLRIKKFFYEYKMSPKFRRYVNVQCWISISMFFCTLAGFLANFWGEIGLNDYLSYSLGIILFLMGSDQFIERLIDTARSDASSSSYSETNLKGK